MEKKIGIILLFIAFAISCKNTDSNNKDSAHSVSNFDTISFASENCLQENSTIFLVKGATKEENYILLKSTAEGSNVWIDSLLFKKKGQERFFSIIRQPTQGYFVLYYNSDSLYDQIVAKNYPRIDTNIVNGEYIEVIIRDSTYNSGYLNYMLFKYKLSKSCILLDDKSSFFKEPI
ncbi:MAG: hypothetical protein K9H84_08365 [Bacteroidales bacterium]|nr:hypothetical protein [Bacteroidales bacterium]